MRRILELDIPEKAVLKGLLVRAPEPVYRDFARAVEATGHSMNKVAVEMMRRFAEEHRDEGIPKQRSMF